MLPAKLGQYHPGVYRREPYYCKNTYAQNIHDPCIRNRERFYETTKNNNNE